MTKLAALDSTYTDTDKISILYTLGLHLRILETSEERFLLLVSTSLFTVFLFILSLHMMRDFRNLCTL
jgi:hypothetical protein